MTPELLVDADESVGIGMVRGRPDSEPVLTIAQLVQAQIDNGVSLRQLESASGGIVAYQHFDKLRRGEVTQWPRSAEAIEATAVALEVDARQVVLSYAAQFGIDVSERRSALASMLPAATDRLSVRQARAIASLVKTFVETDEPGVASIRKVPARSHNGDVGAEPVQDRDLPRAARTRRNPSHPNRDNT